MGGAILEKAILRMSEHYHKEVYTLHTELSHIPYLFGYKTAVSPLQNDYK